MTETPEFLLSPPLFLSSDVPNNIWMREFDPAERVVNLDLAHQQFMQVYNHLAARSLVYLLPAQPGLQDLNYVANIACALPHTPDNTILVANFRSEPRRGETAVGVKFFEQLGRPFEVTPEYFEGEADLKHLRDNVYVCAHGLRTSRNVHEWMSERFGMKIIPFEMTNEYLYHLDCVVFRPTRDHVMVCTDLAGPETTKAIAEHMDLIEVSYPAARAGITNCVRVGDDLLCATHINTLTESHPHYAEEKIKLAEIEQICAKLGLNPVYFELTEILKSGALLSCMVMHLNDGNF